MAAGVGVALWQDVGAVIAVAGEWWGTAAQIAQHLGHGVTPDMVRKWAARRGLANARLTDDNGRPQRRYLLAQAQRIDRQIRHEGRGAPRRAAA